MILAEKRKLKELWIMTGFLCCFVVMGHLMSVPVDSLVVGSKRHVLFYIFNKGFTFAVPGFVFLSGLKLTYSYGNKKFVFVEFLKKRFSKILIPYVFWYVAYYCLFMDLGYVEPKTAWGHLFSFFMGDMVSPFYFITIVFQFYLLFGLILMLFRKFKHRHILWFSLVLQIVYLEFVFPPYEDRFFMTYFIFFIVGCYAALHLEEFVNFLRKYCIGIYLAFMGITAWHIVHSYASAYSQTPYAHFRLLACLFSVFAVFALFHFSEFMSRHLPKFLLAAFKWMDMASYGIFLCHSYLIYVFNETWSQMGIYSVMRRFVYNTVVVYTVAIIGVIVFIIIKKNIYRKILEHKG